MFDIHVFVSYCTVKPVLLPRQRSRWAYTSKYEVVINTQGSFVEAPI